MESANQIRKLEDELFIKWQQRMKSNSEEHWDRFVPDGVVDPKNYSDIHPKIVLLLKEVHDDPNIENLKPWKLYDYLFDGHQDAGAFMWDVVARWVSAIIFGNETWDDYNRNKPFLKELSSDQEFRATMLRNIAVVNVKKTGGGSKSDKTLIKKHCKNYGDFIHDQIQMYKPNIIISGLGDQRCPQLIFCNHVLKWIESSVYPYSVLSVFKDENVVLIDGHHPGAFPVARRNLHENLISTVIEIRKYLGWDTR